MSADQVIMHAERELQAGRPAQAVALARQSLRRNPNDVTAHRICTLALMGLGDFGSAQFHAERCATLAPQSAEAHNSLGVCIAQQQRHAQAIPHFERAMALLPSWHSPRTNLGMALTQVKRFGDAVAMIERVLAESPDDPIANLTLGKILFDTGDVERSVDLCRRATRLMPGQIDAWRCLAPSIAYVDDSDPALILAEHRRLSAIEAGGGALAAEFANARDPERRLRLGFVSGDLRTHSVAFFLEALLEHLDRAAFEVFAYDNGVEPDETTRRLENFTSHWRKIRGLADDAVAAQIREDQIDVLVDLGGHSLTGRIGVFCRRGAPIQVTYLGYAATTGVDAMDYRIVDSITDPLGAEVGCSERLIRLDPCFVCYRPPRGAIERGATTDRSHGVTFCSFNATIKISVVTARLWAGALGAVPGSRLLLKSSMASDPFTQSRILGKLEMAGIDPARVRFLEYTRSQAEHLKLYDRADIALDTSPYNGTTTTCEALWMGVPVVTFRGNMHAGRVGATLLTNVGLPDLVADSPESYARIAAGLAQDETRLRTLHRTLRGRLLSSPLCDGAALAGRFGRAMKSAWREWCAVGK